jgi:quercetin dioxygenase-like cupin family protein
MEAAMKHSRLLMLTTFLGIGLYAGCSEDGGGAADPTSTSQVPAASAAQVGAHQDMTDDIQWVPAPPQYPPGALFALLQGNPSVAGEPFAVRFRMPRGYTIPPHWHPGEEAVTVIKGTLLFGMGDMIGESGWLPPIREGGFVIAAKTTNHYVRARTAVEIQVHGVGPSSINYVNPEDDPRNQ